MICDMKVDRYDRLYNSTNKDNSRRDLNNMTRLSIIDDNKVIKTKKED
jgi:hypothetical protein